MVHARKYLACFVLFLFWLAGCDTKKMPEVPATNLKTGKENNGLKEQQVSAFLNLYAPTDTFPISISTKAGEWEGPESPNFKWHGRIVPSVYWPIFHSWIPYNRFAPEPLFFATKRFRVNKTTWALLTRAPGAFWPSQVFVFLFDTDKRKIINSFRVAEAWADLGDSFYLEAKITKLKENRFVIYLNQSECHPLDENYEKFTCTDSLKTYSLNHTVFRIIAQSKGKK
jgi:hypothetical protein